MESPVLMGQTFFQIPTGRRLRLAGQLLALNLVAGPLTAVEARTHELPAPETGYQALATSAEGGAIIRREGTKIRVDVGTPGKPARTTYYADEQTNILVIHFAGQKPVVTSMESAPFLWTERSDAEPGASFKVAGEACTEYEFTGNGAGYMVCMTRDWIPVRLRYVDRDRKDTIIFQVTSLTRGPQIARDLTPPATQ
jgi:hypothetical protein